VFIDQDVPTVEQGRTASERAGIAEALEHMKFAGGMPIKGVKVDVAFLGSCTNGRLSDLKEVARFLEGRKVYPGVQAICVPGSQGVARVAEELGLDRVFREAGFEWRAAGCSMCLAMNPDKLVGDQLCASSSNRNFKGRQGSVTGRTILMSPLMVAAAAVTGEVSDAREVFGILEPAGA
jgi:3-isopropylmalate/(R)-2-methylmalate dehydratase large subunit